MLELTTAPPAKSKPVRLVTANDLWGHSFRALGFPVGYEQGVWASGVLRGRQADGWLQIEDTKETGYLVALGFSGDVVGMIVAADTDNKAKIAADALPVRAAFHYAKGWNRCSIRCKTPNTNPIFCKTYPTSLMR